MIRFLLSALIGLCLSLAGCATATPPSTATPPAATTPPPATASSTDPMGGIVGEWTYAVASMEGFDEGLFTITGSPDAYAGEIVARGEVYPLRLIAFDGDAFSFEFQVGTGPVVRCSGVVENGEFNGTADAGPFGTFPMTATHASKR